MYPILNHRLSTLTYYLRFDSGGGYDNALEITDWDIVDIFCYFSHNFVTIPPLSWIHACNRHGALVMGTFITEWEAGPFLYMYSSSQY